MTLKFYFHTAATNDTGTLPSTTASVSATTPTDTPGATGKPLLTNKSMDGIIGVLQTSTVLTTDAVTTAQPQPIVRFCSAPLAAQTIAAQAINVHFGSDESNSSSQCLPSISLELWRPSTGAVVGRLYDLTTNLSSVASTTEGDAHWNTPPTCLSVTAQDGDILVIEIWRGSQVQSMSTAYTNTVFYDGTVEASFTDNAAYLVFTNDVTMQGGGGASPNPPPWRTLLGVGFCLNIFSSLLRSTN